MYKVGRRTQFLHGGEGSKWLDQITKQDQRAELAVRPFLMMDTTDVTQGRMGRTSPRNEKAMPYKESEEISMNRKKKNGKITYVTEYYAKHTVGPRPQT
jgi:hypothetical protein